MPLDTRTLVVVAFLTSLVLALILLLTWWVNRPMNALRYWSAGYFIYAVGLMEVASRDAAVLTHHSIIGVTAFPTALTAIWMGTRVLRGGKPPWAVALALITGMIASFSYFFWIEPSFTIRFLLYGLFSAMLSGIASYELFRSARDGLFTPTGILAMLYALGALSNTVRSVGLMTGAINIEALVENGTTQTVMFLQAIVMLVAIGVCMVVVTTEQLQRELRIAATYDRLTGLLNRNAYVDMAEREFARWQRSRAPFSVLLMDIDHFKRINDSFGHAAGDVVLQSFARVCTAGLRESDLFGRYGGEEFCAVLPSTTLDQAVIVAERLRQDFSDLVVMHEGCAISTTVSIGVVEVDPAVPDLDSLIARADRALYRAKHQGRDRVVVAELVAA